MKLTPGFAMDMAIIVILFTTLFVKDVDERKL
jgi:hypothetical protein